MNQAEVTCTRCGQPAGAHATLARRVMTARLDGTVCHRCKMTVRRGHQIAEVDGRWLHIECALGRKPPMIGWPSAA